MSLNELGLDCKTCNENQKIERGCIEDSPIPDKWEISGVKYNRCPLAVLDKDVFWYVRAFNYLEKGILPNAGGWMDQTNKFIEAMDFINNKRQENGRK